jgi:hypothetical protein
VPITLLPSKSSRLAHSARGGLELALLSEFEAMEGKLVEQLITATPDNLVANGIRGQILMLREIKTLVKSIGEKNG